MRRLLALGQGRRAAALLTSIDDSASGLTAEGMLAAAAGQRGAAAELFAKALASSGDDAARFCLAWLWRDDPDDLPPEYAEAAATLGGSARAVWSGVRSIAEGGAPSPELESRLADARPSDLWYDAALRMRASWRVATANAEDAAEALTLLELLPASELGWDDLQLRAEAAALAGEPHVLLESVAAMADQLVRMPASPQRAAMRGRLASWLAQAASDPRTSPSRVGEVRVRLGL